MHIKNIVCLGSLWLTSSCAFFTNEYSSCSDDPATCQSKLSGLGGEANGSGGNAATGGSAQVETTGGSSSGGNAAGGTASGGDGSGGDASGGTAGALFINEVHDGVLSWVEIINLGSSAVDLSGYIVGSGANSSDVTSSCALDGASVDAGQLLLVQNDSAPCISGSNCVVDCTLSIAGSSYIFLRSAGIDVDAPVQFPADSSPEYPGIYDSWSASDGGSDSFCRTSATPGATNASCP